MARKVTLVLVDDLDGSAADGTVEFALDGIVYEIDLSAKNAAELRRTVGSWIPAARRVGGRSKAGRGRPSQASGSETGRAWARQHGYDIAERGRLPADIVAAFRAAHPSR
ncbi:MAG TPA: Lsr2 family protein [Mycobacterium sp.]|nr:Lsr2 family protein [Mycobacterium sp.]